MILTVQENLGKVRQYFRDHTYQLDHHHGRHQNDDDDDVRRRWWLCEAA